MNLAEFRLSIRLRHAELEDRMYNVFRFETVRQFRTFSYEVDVTREIDEEKEEITFEVRGVSVPEQSLASVGPAVTEFVEPALHGTYRVVVRGAKEETAFTLRLMPKTMKIVDGPDDGMIAVELVEEIEEVE